MNNIIPTVLTGLLLTACTIKVLQKEDMKEHYVNYPQEVKKDLKKVEKQLINYEMEEDMISDSLMKKKPTSKTDIYEVETLDLPEEVPSYVYDRLYKKQLSSRQKAMGDLIRGDLPIRPISKEQCGSLGAWFIPSTARVESLHPGALSQISSVRNDVRSLQEQENL